MTKIILRVLNEDGPKSIKVCGFDDARGAMSWLTERGFEHDDGCLHFWFKRDVRAIGTSIDNIYCGGGYVSAKIVTEMSDENFTAIEFRPFL